MACNEGKQFKNKAPECDKLDCWCFPEPYAEQKVTVKNKKYCWLYPQGDAKKLNQIKPNFEHCETLYTLCDYRLENYVFKQLLLIEIQIRNYAKKLAKEMRFQRKILEDMWRLSEKFLLLSQYSCCVKTYPEIVSLPAENYVRCKFQKKLKAINLSICRLVSSLDAIRTSIRKLNTVCAQMDMTVQSPFMLGDHNIRPLSYYRKLVDDTFEYFHDMLCSLKSWTQLLDVGDANTIHDFHGILDPAKKYSEFMNIGKVDCTCMRTRNTEGIMNFVNKCN
ncbi:uncharacterized protein LOC101458862 [Ceratitis capitata]|uniref:uncharacterized protein LOC101458862 n=1 Tax=Ceratitis capitata TaxID=7213 RepID=UPI000618872F|nr:uncharacterized protein LOC101458862 [Ceratitis capitata]